MHNCKLFIGNLSPTTTTEILLKFYSHYGKVIECKILRHAVTKESRGFGFVTFSNAEMVDAAMNARPHFVGGRMVDPRRALPKEVLDETSGPIATNRIFVRGISHQHNPETLEEYFSRFGNVTEVTIMVDPATGKRRGYAVVCFDDYDPVDRAIKVLCITVQKYHVVDQAHCVVSKFLSRERQRKSQNGSVEVDSY
ncbi:Heterogeneous nuclear ribonucleoprotein A1 [Trichuris trichiura]|uniref:Heterogeneous nuclear ribonucleoprotein A1 n=1 Tax=Trichuris trichiura TaxID=36087 RepID=A0A077ZKS6_TRITR|nr:Heterogeneous nuclear ribonucleoprotein A1 [Trichuris trichiura]